MYLKEKTALEWIQRTKYNDFAEIISFGKLSINKFNYTLQQSD